MVHTSYGEVGDFEPANLGINALYAANLAMNAVNALRETFREADYIRTHPIITGGSVVNAIPSVVTVENQVRAANMESLVATNEKINRAMAGAAAAMGDISCLMPAIHPYCRGAAGPAHSDDYRIASVEKAGLPRLVPHCCRHTFSTLLKDVEGNKLDKMRIVGHSDEKTSNHYTHSQMAELSKITDQLR